MDKSVITRYENPPGVTGLEALPHVLKHLGIPSLRKGQDSAIHAIISGQDTYNVLPTGHGKSLIFIAPTLANNWRTIIITPLIALMQDHLQNCLRAGVRCAQVSSGQDDHMNKQAIQDYCEGKINILFVSPERTRNTSFLEATIKHTPDYMVVDEAHQISQHGLNFRPDYYRIGSYAAIVKPKVIATLTATAPIEVERDIYRVMSFDETTKRIVYLPRRKNLNLRSEYYDGDYQLMETVNELDGSGIIYFATVKQIEAFYKDFATNFRGGALIYHGKLRPSEKKSNQELWMSGEVRVALCTCAFGLGINKPDTRFVVYRDYPGSPEELSQGFGRCGRDGQEAECLLFNNSKSIRTQEFFIETGYPTKNDITKYYNAIASLADSNGLCDHTHAELCKRADVHNMASSAIMTNLMAFEVVERQPSSKVVSIKCLRGAADPRFRKYLAPFQEYGFVNENGFMDSTLDFLAEILQTTEQTVKNNLIKLSTDGFIKLELNTGRKPIQLLGGLDKVDFDLIREQRERAYTRLQTVVDFWDVEDENKHDFLEEYFKRDYNITDDEE